MSENMKKDQGLCMKIKLKASSSSDPSSKGFVRIGKRLRKQGYETAVPRGADDLHRQGGRRVTLEGGEEKAREKSDDEMTTSCNRFSQPIEAHNISCSPQGRRYVSCTSAISLFPSVVGDSGCQGEQKDGTDLLARKPDIIGRNNPVERKDANEGLTSNSHLHHANCFMSNDVMLEKYATNQNEECGIQENDQRNGKAPNCGAVSPVAQEPDKVGVHTPPKVNNLSIHTNENTHAEMKAILNSDSDVLNGGVTGHQSNLQDGCPYSLKPDEAGKNDEIQKKVLKSEQRTLNLEPINERSSEDEMTVNRIGRLAIDYSKEIGEPLDVAKEAISRILIHSLLQDLIPVLTKNALMSHSNRNEASREVLSNPTSGVSYVMESESKQVMLEDRSPLPHVVVRPPVLPAHKEKNDNKVEALVEVLRNSRTTCTIFSQIRDEIRIKDYLLWPERRSSIINKMGTFADVRELDGINHMVDILCDRSFVCMHFCLKGTTCEDVDLVPCMKPRGYNESKFDTKFSSSPENRNSLDHGFLDASNVQLGIFVRKGVGGTCPMKSASKKPIFNAYLSTILDTYNSSKLTESKYAHENADYDQQDLGDEEYEIDHEAMDVEGDAGGNNSMETENENQNHIRIEETNTMVSLKLATLSCRLELFIQRELWAKLSRTVQELLVNVVHELEAKVASAFKAQNWSRLLQCSKKLESKMNTSIAEHPLCQQLLSVISRPCHNSGIQEFWIRVTFSFSDSGTVNVTFHPKEINRFCDGDKESLDDANRYLDNKICMDIEARYSENRMYYRKERGNNGLHVNYSATDSTDKTEGLTKRMGQQKVSDEETNFMERIISQMLGRAVEVGDSSFSYNFSDAAVLISACIMATSRIEGIQAVQMQWPFYLIGTRDHFTRELVATKKYFSRSDGRQFVQKKWYFKHGQIPEDYHQCAIKFSSEVNNLAVVAPSVSDEIIAVMHLMLDNVSECLMGCQVADESLSEYLSNPKNECSLMAPVGITTYEDIFTDSELCNIEICSDATNTSARSGELPHSCYHDSVTKNGLLKRTKFFFGARYLWSRKQILEPYAKIAKGVRVDVPEVPHWMKNNVEEHLTAHDIIPENYVDSVALNMYHDGSEGIQSHFDDSERFIQPIYSLRIFSDSRLSFGGTLFGNTNAMFFTPMPRGCVTVMEGYAANGVKHCVRPSDMDGKSAGMILRRINPSCRSRAETFLMDETLMWLQNWTISTPNLDESSSTSHFEKNNNVSEQQIQERRQRANALATAVTLLGAVRRVEAAESLGLEFSDPIAASVWCVIDDLMHFCERAIEHPPLSGTRGIDCASSRAKWHLRGNSSSKDRKRNCLLGRKRRDLELSSQYQIPESLQKSQPSSSNKINTSKTTAVSAKGVSHEVVSRSSGGSNVQSEELCISPRCKRFKRLSSEIKKESISTPNKSESKNPSRQNTNIRGFQTEYVRKRIKLMNSNVPRSICLVCLGSLDSDSISTESSEQWYCQGGCCRAFHRACRKAAIESAAVGTICEQCSNNSHSCFLCQKSGSGNRLLACGQRGCGTFYHQRCLLRNPHTKTMQAFGRGFKCPLHWCNLCKLSGTSSTIVSCVRCCTAYHIKCLPKDSKVLSKNYILCSKHIDNMCSS